MRNSLFSRLAIVGICIAIITTTALASIHAKADTTKPPHRRILCSGLSDTVGLVIDKRGNMYTANQQTGHVFCVSPGFSPILLAKVPGTPTALAVDSLRNVFVGTVEGTIYLVALDGSVDTAYHCASRPLGLDIDRDGGLVIVTENGQIIKIRRKDFAKLQ